MQEWAQVAKICKRGNLIPFFDCAYQGFGRGLEEDAEAVRLFAREGLEFFLAVSHSKNFSLYGERVGCLFVVTEGQDAARRVESRIKQVVRTNYSNPPRHGAQIVAHILNDTGLKQEWRKEVDQMRGRIGQMRKALYDKLSVNDRGTDFSQLLRSQGMFVYSGLRKEQVEQLKSAFGIYMTSDGRMNLCGLTHKNIDYVAQAIGGL